MYLLTLCQSLRRAACPSLGLLLAWLALATLCARAELPVAEWELYRQSYLSADGRVIDTVNERVSHSEGQGYGMLLAEAWGDAETFEKLWTWTRTRLQIRGEDRLLAWRWRPVTPDSNEGRVDDMNNATDGDILVAWALYRASVRWLRKEYYDAAADLVRDIRVKTVRRNGQAAFLLPAAKGFEHQGFTVLNLSYWIFPAFDAFARIDSPADWLALNATGLALLRKARFGDYALPPDWLQVSPQTVKPAEEFEPVFGYNAIRIPLHLWWGGQRDPALYEPYADFLDAQAADGKVPATLNLNTNAKGEHDALPGMRAILDLATSAHRRQPPSSPGSLPAGESYYSASLLMLMKVALEDQRLSTQKVPLPSSIQLGPGIPGGQTAP